MTPRYPRWCRDNKQSPGRPVSRLPKCSMRPSGRAQGGPQVRPQAGPRRPKIIKNGPQCLRKGPQKVPLSNLMDKISLGTVWVAFWPCLDPCGPETVSIGPKMCSLGPRMCPVGWNRKIAVSRARWTGSRIRGQFVQRANPHFRWFPPLSLSLSLGRVLPPLMRA